MASSQNLSSFEPFLFRHTFPDSWISEAYARDTETLTRALQSTFSNFNSVSSPPLSDSFPTSSDHIVNNPLFNLVYSDSTTAPPTPTASNVSACSDPDTAPVAVASIKRRNVVATPGATGKVTKRKSRASKKSQTTFITADPANFRQMVQQITGVRFSDSQLPFVPVLKPEPHRFGNRFHGDGAGGCLPTLDTSAFLLDHQQQQQITMGSASGSGSVIGSGSVSFAQPVLADGGTDARLDLDSVSSFPTLDSWN